MTEKEMKDFQKTLFLVDVANGVCEMDGTPYNGMLSKEDNLHYLALSIFSVQAG